MTTWRILRMDLGYKIVLTQELRPTDHRLRRGLAGWALEQLERDAYFRKKINYSDEAHFSMNGFDNEQNMRYWAEKNPQVIQQKSMHPQKITVWCCLWPGGILGPYFFEEDGATCHTQTDSVIRTSRGTDLSVGHLARAI